MSKPKKVYSSSTHYWCDFCAKFIKNTAIDRKNHENGIPHQEAKAKKISELRSASAESKLMDQLAALEKAAMNSSSADNNVTGAPHAQFSTYTPASTVAPSPQLSKPPSSKPEKSTSKPTPTPAASDEPNTVVELPPKAKEAAMPGQWEVIEEDAEENPYLKGEQAAEIAASEPEPKLNPKKRDRNGQSESDLDQMEAESRAHASTNTERVPEQYRATALATSSSEEPIFKSKVNKGANIKKRVKQL